MAFRTVLTKLTLSLLLIQAVSALPWPRGKAKDHDCLEPKVFIISMFSPEAEVWYGIPDFNVLAQNITIPGLSPLFPDAHCTTDGDICQLTTGEGEINAAATIQALTLYPGFNLSKTYFMVAGIAGVNPEVSTLASVNFARFAVQVAQQYEFDIRDIGNNFSSGYIPYGTDLPAPAEYPQNFYGTEVFEVNVALRDKAMEFASQAKLNDSAATIAYRAKYSFAAARKAPSIVACDVATSDNYYSGSILSTAFGNFTKLLTNGTGVYCSSAQEDNATLESMLRAAKFKKVDFSRIIVMRASSDFDRPPPKISAYDHLLFEPQGGV